MAGETLLKEGLFWTLKGQGAALYGVGDLSLLTVEQGLTTGVAVAVNVPKKIVEDLKVAPTEEYYNMYYELNNKLDRIVEAGAAFLQKHGYRAIAQTTSYVKQDETWTTPLPHKTVATRAGLGWIGKNCLLVTPRYGSAVRLSSLITDAPLPFDTPLNRNGCGMCRKCVDSCPGGALSGIRWEPGIDRARILDMEICKRTQTERMEAATGIHTDLCGLCFAVCPYTIAYLRRAEK